jgi:hypothetical protein
VRNADMHVATVLLAIAGDPNAEAARALRDFLTSWPAQAALAALYVGLAALAFTRVEIGRASCRGRV